MHTSPQFHCIGYGLWTEVLTIRVAEDWEEALRISPFVREIRCLDGVITPNRREVLSLFPKLYAASVECHSDVKNDNANRFAYRNVFTKLPGSLRRLEIKHAHGPDINVIKMVKSYSPDLEELRLGRCTMFNCTPACLFWENFPFDHNSYISDQGTDAYTHSLGQELAPLHKLTAISLGVYLTPSDIVLVHRVFHSRNLAVPNEIGWQQALQMVAGHQAGDNEDQQNLQRVRDLVSLLHTPPQPEENFSRDACRFCYDHSYELTKRAEDSANAILKQLIPSLEKTEWMSWFTPNHLGVSTHMYRTTNSFKI
ncbi:hypothetical protein RhiJN_17412 [Ceratobasidium sp. AG-Ba]|nr:hypothetical protein RhiJN_17412 [Ceratobasidium sp. AG-Ba]